MRSARQRGPYFIPPQDREYRFPDPRLAMREPDGLLAIGGDLSEQRLTAAYRLGVFPWYNDGQPILWWSPNPRAVLFPQEVKVSRSLGKTLRQGRLRISFDSAFHAVVQACAAPRRDGGGTWIVTEMAAAYARLHAAGIAHSVECWAGEALVGGLYGVALGRVFYGESMFHRVRDASKVALVTLARRLDAWGYALIDCQVGSDHLTSLGAKDIDREAFLGLLARYAAQPQPPGAWARPSRGAQEEGRAEQEGGHDE